MTIHSDAKRLRVLEARVPALECKGLCSAFCCPVEMSMGPAEQRRMRSALGGTELSHDPQTLTCSALKDERCSAYAARPMLCRLFGAVDTDLMRCPHGCVPLRWLSDDEGKALLRETGSL